MGTYDKSELSGQISPALNRISQPDKSTPKKE